MDWHGSRERLSIVLMDDGEYGSMSITLDYKLDDDVCMGFYNYNIEISYGRFEKIFIYDMKEIKRIWTLKNIMNEE